MNSSGGGRGSDRGGEAPKKGGRGGEAPNKGGRGGGRGSEAPMKGGRGGGRYHAPNYWDIFCKMYGLDHRTGYSFVNQLVELMIRLGLMKGVPLLYLNTLDETGHDITIAFKSTKSLPNPLEESDRDQYQLLQWWGQNVMLTTTLMLRIGVYFKDHEGRHLEERQKELIRSVLGDCECNMIAHFEHVIKMINTIETSALDDPETFERTKESVILIQAMMNTVLPVETVNSLLCLPMAITSLDQVPPLIRGNGWAGSLNYILLSDKFMDKHGRGGEMPAKWSEALVSLKTQAATRLTLWARRIVARRVIERRIALRVFKTQAATRLTLWARRIVARMLMKTQVAKTQAATRIAQWVKRILQKKV